MIVLGIETATTVCSAGIVRDGQVIGEFRLAVKNIHAEALTESVRQLLVLLKMPFAALDGIAVSIGPGSFTGLRIGLATAKGLAFSLSKPIAGIQTLYALAAAAQIHQPHGAIVPVIRSRQNELYAARFRSAGGTLECVEPAAAFSVTAFNSWLQPPAVVCGNAVPMLVADRAPGIEILPEAACLLSGGGIAELGAQRFKRGEADGIADLEPMYVQDFQLGPRNG